ncbi:MULTISPECIES: ABC transporter permease subunit [Pseudochrobactrum]|jgi:glutathione transport system permease protein|uniref:Glutathione transport system permease protein GsiD n=2 Tax=Pseudochrobactrum TaxID=354349 RepID=A0A366E5H1_9HYPH|nr:MULTISPECIES: ABC transporter permease subunit [Pseudochrobactrum]MBX8802413.1 ABC transporter permease subunit [Ochrobactrum sp. MR28]MBX8817961.1 ABC transporter permease subunit [Ochrobactrum sp. MR31]MDR2309961.1 ABC transporter permease subunit [Brucellaceae bacterium]MDM7850066.1 ABC transporter permease subunit [Pseudochrobactrum kiredjianiae]RBO97325.1 glutathione transport system permease protein [Pseudochrobactrum asaccharolyticum]
MSATTVVVEPTEKMRKPLAEFWRRFKKQKVAVIALIFIITLVLMAVFAPFVAPYDPTIPDYNAVLQGPSAAHWAGTDTYGRDIFSRIIWGARISLSVGFLSVTLGALAGVSLGIISGYYGRWIDSAVMRLCDLLLAFPGILLAIAVIAILGPGITNVIYAVAIFSIPVFARLARGTTLQLKRTVYVDASRAIGVKDRVIMLRHILPGTLPNVIVYFSMRIGTSILTAASLSFIGLGAQPPSPEWGAMLADGRSYMGVADHLTLFPGIAIFVTVLGFNLFGDGLRDALDPKLRSD